MKGINVTISLYFKVKDAEIFGGAGEVGYSEINMDLAAEDLSSVKLQIFAEENITNFAEMFKVPKENVRIISRTEYKANTEVE